MGCGGLPIRIGGFHARRVRESEQRKGDEMSTSREVDVAILGATGSVGQAMSSYFSVNAPASLRWAMCGRPKSNVQKLLTDLVTMHGPRSPPRLMHADVSDPESLRRVAAKTAVILTSIGPYTKYGEAVVVACIEERAHYVDITGELWWVAEMRAKYGERARAAGVCIVSFAGYDCVPFELSALLAHKTLMKGGERLASMECLTKFDGGGFPPGLRGECSAVGGRASANGAVTRRLLTCGCVPCLCVERQARC